MESLPTKFQTCCFLPEEYCCPVCGNVPLIVKHRFRTDNLDTSGVLLGCDNWKNARVGKCYCEWNVGEARKQPWHTWITWYPHQKLMFSDVDRGGHGKAILDDLRVKHGELFAKISGLLSRYRKVFLETLRTQKPESAAHVVELMEGEE